jgi:hypothetical protein
LHSILCAAVLWAAPVSADPYFKDPDIVWSNYVLIEKPYDTKLSCPRLKAEIAHVESDIRILIKAQRRTEDAIRQAFDTQNSMGRDQGGFLNTGTSKVAFAYVKGRDQIKESRRIAELRRDHLQSLLPSCRAAPGQ